MNNSYRIATLVAAVVTTGLLAGLYYGYACSVMGALGQSDDKTFVEVMNRINVVIVNPWFMISFLGSAGLSVLAAIFYRAPDQRRVLLWIAIGLVLNVLSFLITSGINVPLNNQLAATGAPNQVPDFVALRSQFESSWVRWNIVRMAANLGAFGALTWAAVMSGRR
ncbi:anthrone oxygenase family protein [Nocardia stercoris]|uniref:DUF1772 domain-containing protein n=1 Tax=Nocardia stercoris TaxID=2483361 RepID=A0A3M2LDI6_9NOCA|nr:anthrone oxygenase family protein [Nocardia stercoris]RMI35599.1 DUF1772 domain-containing protein [Nocardia stercoris]